MIRAWRITVTSLLVLPTLVLGAGRPYDYGFDTRGLVRRQTSPSRILVVNLQDGTEKGIPARVEIREMQKDLYKWNLFLLAMSMFLFADFSEPDSWYQIAGIHGFPFLSWNGVPGVNFTAGFCQHSSILFPTWHRPYIALVEQQLHSRMMFIASLFTDEREREDARAAVSDWRMPYWDWAAVPPDGGPVFMEEFGHRYINVYGPNDWQEISNPLYSYHFGEQELETMNYPLWNETLRAPSDNTSDAYSRNDNVTNQIDRDLPRIQQTLFMLFSSYKEYAIFSNKGYLGADNETQYDSIERLHDGIHSVVGRRGHMEYTIYAAFDPIFFLHHANVDRITAMWQALNPDSWVTPRAALEPSWTNQVGDVLNATTGLTPFYLSDDGRFWDSELVRETISFGYVYDTTANVSLTGESAPEALDRLREIINEKYGRESPAAMLGEPRRRMPEFHDGVVAARFRDAATADGRLKPDLSGSFPLPSPPLSAIVKHGNRYTEWLVNIRMKDKEMDRPTSVLFFIGDVPDEPSSWRSAPNMVGAFETFFMGGSSTSDSQISGTVPLTAALLKMVAGGLVPSLDPEDMTPYLQRYLQFRLLNVDDAEVGLDEMKGLCINVASAFVRAPSKKTEFPEWDRVVTRFSMIGEV